MNAFPIAIPAGCDGYEDGMTLRDYFAGQVLAGLTANHTLDLSYRHMAERAYYIADAMLAERSE
jgi:hypothetical protein